MASGSTYLVSDKARYAMITTRLIAPDTRSTNESPSTLMGWGLGVTSAFKYRSTVGTPNGSGTYGIILNLTPWRDSSGSYPKQLWIDDSSMSIRHGTSDSAWSNWSQFVTNSGTWAINITGSAKTATTATHATTFGSADTCRVYFHNSDECNFAGTNTSTNLYFNYRAEGEGRPIPTNFVFGGSGGTATIKAGKVLNAVWNDFAEFRIVDIHEPGRVVVPTTTGIATKSTKRLQYGGRIISDTFGCAVGESEEAKTPLGMAGRVLAYPYRNIDEYQIGDCVCTAPNGTVDIMTREEIKEWPDRIIGIVNEIPTYEVWEQKLVGHDPNKLDAEKYATIQRVEVKGRIWIDIK